MAACTRKSRHSLVDPHHKLGQLIAFGQHEAIERCDHRVRGIVNGPVDWSSVMACSSGDIGAPHCGSREPQAGTSAANRCVAVMAAGDRRALIVVPQVFQRSRFDGRAGGGDAADCKSKEHDGGDVVSGGRDRSSQSALAAVLGVPRPPSPIRRPFAIT